MVFVPTGRWVIMRGMVSFARSHIVAAVALVGAAITIHYYGRHLGPTVNEDVAVAITFWAPLALVGGAIGAFYRRLAL
jgi:hypothetical protein